MPDAQMGQRVHQRIGHRRQRAHAARLARALDAQNVRLSGNRARLDVDMREDLRMGHGVVHEGARQRLPALGIEADLLHQHLPDTLRNAADDLPLEQQGIEHIAHIVHHHITVHLHLPGVLIDLEFDNVAAVGIVLLGGVIGGGGVEAQLHTLRQVLGAHGGARHILHGEGAVGLAGREDALRIIHLIDAHHMGRDLLRLVDDLVGGDGHSRAAQRRGARTARAFTKEDLIGVALEIMDLVGMDAEGVRNDLLEDGLVALALGHRTREHRDGPRPVKAHFGALIARRSGFLDGVGNTDAAQLAALARLRPAGLETLVIDHVEGLIEHLLELAAVEVEGQARLEGHLLRRDHVATAQLRRINPQLIRRQIDDALDDEGRLRAPIAAKGTHGIGVRINRRHVHMDRGGEIDARQRAEVAIGAAVCAGLGVAAHVHEVMHAQAQEHAVLVEREFRVRDIVAAMGVGQEALRAGAHPFHGIARHLGGQQHQTHFVEHARLHAEAAADVARHHAQAALGDVQRLGQFLAEVQGALQGRVDRVAVRRLIVMADRAARLHSRRRHAADHEALLDDVVGLGEGGVGRLLIALEMHEADVVFAIVPDEGRAGLRAQRHGSDGGQDLVVDLDQFGGVLRLFDRVRDDEGDGIADIAHLHFRQRGEMRAIHGRAVALLLASGPGQIAVTGVGPILADQNGANAGRRLRLRGVEARDFRMGVGGAQHDAKEHAGEGEIVHITTAALQKARILKACNRLSDCKLTHGVRPFSGFPGYGKQAGASARLSAPRREPLISPPWPRPRDARRP